LIDFLLLSRNSIIRPVIDFVVAADIVNKKRL